MLSVSIGSNYYLIPGSARDVPVRKYLEYCDFVKSAKTKKQQLIDELEKEKAKANGQNLEVINFKLSEILSSYSDFEREYDNINMIVSDVSFWSKAPKDIIWQCNYDDIIKIHNIIHNSISNVTVDPAYNGFTIEQDSYFLPNEKMKGNTLIEFVEAQQLRSFIYKITNEDYGSIDINSGLPIVSNWLAVLHIACVICRKKDEAYRPNLVSERAKVFAESLTFYDLVQIWFFFLKSKMQ